MHMRRNLKKFLLLPILFISVNLITPAMAAVASSIIDKTQLVSQQTELLKNRLSQAQGQLVLLENQDDRQLSDLMVNHTTRQLRSQASLDIAVAKSNLDSINIELSESQQSISRLEKEAEEIENQLNVFSVFGVKTEHTDSTDVTALRADEAYQKNLLELEKTRADYLTELQKIAEQTFNLQKSKYARVNVLSKSRTIVQLKERLAQSEVNFQQEQSYWMKHLNTLYAQLNKADAQPVKDKTTYNNLQREIFYANENLNFTYVQMLIVRYQDQLQQLKVVVLHSRSITLLNKANDQVQLLTKQLVRVKELLKTRLAIIDKRKTFLSSDRDASDADKADLVRLTRLANEFQLISKNVANLDEKLSKFQSVINQALQYELSSRQGLPGWDGRAWLDLGAEIWLAPGMAFQVIKSLAYAVVTATKHISAMSVFIIALIELSLITLFMLVNKLLGKIAAGMAEQAGGHINLKRLCVQVLRRNMIDLLVIGNIVALFSFCSIPAQTSNFLINLTLVWLFFKVLITMARICLVESVHNRAGHDVILYHRLKWSFLIGGIITASTVFMHQLPIVYEVKDLFDRLFLMFMLVVSIFLLKSWEVLPGLILPHIDDRRLYLKRIVRLVCLLLPLILLVNSAIGLFGFVNLVLTVCWYESIFVLMLVSYLILRGVLIDSMMYLSSIMIRHVDNGWLWTEAFLKPIDKILRVTLFVTAWIVLFMCYGWNEQSQVVTQLTKVLHYPLLNVLNTTITPLNISELTAVIYLLFWSARWTREFVYRALSTRTKDMGLRNSLAIFSQYAMIVIGIFICLRVLGIDLKALAVVAGAFAFGVGLGLRDLFNNFACGFLLLIERPVRVGDTVTINGSEGEVIHIGGRAVTIKTWDHMEVIVPNADIFSKSFTNWTARDPIVRSIIAIKTHRHDNPPEVQAIIHQVLVKHRDVLAEPAPEVLLKEMSESLIEFEVRYFINLRQIKSRVGLRSEVLMAIWETFERHGLQPPYPQHEIYVRGGSVPLLSHNNFEKIFQPSPLAGE
jgi:potassium efflux system protein